MKTKFLVIAVLALLLVLITAIPVFAQGASECGAGFGQLHKDFATSGFTGQGPNRGGHVPGQAHTGAAGLCGVGVGS